MCLIIITSCVVVVSIYAVLFLNSVTHSGNESGRYIQVDHRQNAVIFGSSMRTKNTAVIDTKTGAVKDAVQE